jgi:hypothetical protein
VKNLIIGIPAYNQPLFIEELFCGIRQQKFTTELFVYDDCSTSDYNRVIESFNDLTIVYKRNDKNLGAMANMQYCYNDIVEWHSPEYLMIMHEDDGLAPNFLSTITHAISSHNRHPKLILSYFKEFVDYAEIAKFNNNSSVGNFSWVKKKDLVELFVKNHNIAFGSAVYNVKNYQAFNFDFIQFGEFADRPLLLEGLNNDDDVLLIIDELYFYRSHVGIDDRWKLLKSKHVYNLLQYYRGILYENEQFFLRDFKKWATGFALDSYQNVRLTGNNFRWFLHIFYGFKFDYISLKYIFLRIGIINAFFTWFDKKF